MNYKISEDRRTLTIFADSEERAAIASFGDYSDEAMHSAFEHLVCNSELEWINPADTHDLTDAPMLGILDEAQPLANEASFAPHYGTIQSGFYGDPPQVHVHPIIERWAFMDYMLRSPLEDLRDKGECVFTGNDAQIVTPKPLKEAFPHDVCPECGAASVPVEKVPDQSFRGCPQCSHTWVEDLDRPATRANRAIKQPKLSNGMDYGTSAIGERICRGAQMGRPNRIPTDNKQPIKMTLRYVPFIDGDYDQGGAYWGSPANLYRAVSADVVAFGDSLQLVEIFVRANSRKEAKANVRALLPNAKFYN
jgi:Zn-finger nucleic acid-binding protein